jgi:hypothetical protein
MRTIQPRTHSILVLLLRYMDDLAALIASPSSLAYVHPYIAKFIQHRTYDQKHKKLTLKLQPDNNFLDSHIVIFNNDKNVKINYNNKNTSCIETNHQTIGRFHDFDTASHFSHKISAPHAILTRIYDYTTNPFDMLLPAIALVHELRLLGYPPNFFFSLLAKIQRTRPTPVWHQIFEMLLLANGETAAARR